MASSDSGFTEHREAGPVKIAASGSVSSSTAHENKEDNGGVDRISELPEGILVSILSLLTFKEAAQTSLLSSRWVNLWKLAVTELDFDAPKVMELLKFKRCLIPEKRIEFKKWVSRVVQQLNDLSPGSKQQLTQFRVSFTLSNQCNSDGDIDGWLKFAISKRVESLDLSLVNYVQIRKSDNKNYLFPEDCFNHIKTPAGLSDIKSLRSLCLSFVDIKSETLEHFIANCPYLEELAVKMSWLLVKLRVAAATGSSLKLKRLEVRRCRHLKSLEIDNVPCLTHFAYQGRQESVELHLEKCISLVDVNIDFDCCRPGLVFHSISHKAAQLATLTLRMEGDCLWFLNVAEFTHLELLTVEIVNGSIDETIIGLATLIHACPRLQTLRVLTSTYSAIKDSSARVLKPSVVRVGHESIKAVEIIGFKGYPVDCEFMEYVLECFVGMERIVVDRSNPTGGMPNIPCSEKQLEEARQCALKFKSRASPAIDFVVK
ncbi:unnamed protein product [Linum tenue]|uniref:F-box domain-containing protein n=1 Tax=Linum tenue TaxID=586396 RepID=A0AAV0IEC2_9ROSI|nr:unnamed protein product [Linum tenue]